MKNSYLIILAAVLILGRQDGFKKILSSVSVEDALSMLKLTGIDQNLIDGVTNILPDVVNGADPVAILKKALPLIISLANADAKTASGSAADYDGTAPVDDFIPDEIKQDLADYFS